jgi:hypothetical protein
MPRTAALPDHGIRARYQLGCRCHPCTLSNTVYMRSYRALRSPKAYRQLELPDVGAIYLPG